MRKETIAETATVDQRAEITARRDTALDTLKKTAHPNQKKFDKRRTLGALLHLDPSAAAQSILKMLDEIENGDLQVQGGKLKDELVSLLHLIDTFPLISN